MKVSNTSSFSPIDSNIYFSYAFFLAVFTTNYPLPCCFRVPVCSPSPFFPFNRRFYSRKRLGSHHADNPICCFWLFLAKLATGVVTLIPNTNADRNALFRSFLMMKFPFLVQHIYPFLEGRSRVRKIFYTPPTHPLLSCFWLILSTNLVLSTAPRTSYAALFFLKKKPEYLEILWRTATLPRRFSISDFDVVSLWLTVGVMAIDCLWWWLNFILWYRCTTVKEKTLVRTTLNRIPFYWCKSCCDEVCRYWPRIYNVLIQK